MNGFDLLFGSIGSALNFIFKIGYIIICCLQAANGCAFSRFNNSGIWLIP